MHGFMARTRILNNLPALPVTAVKCRANLSLKSPATKSEGSVAFYFWGVFLLHSFRIQTMLC